MGGSGVGSMGLLRGYGAAGLVVCQGRRWQGRVSGLFVLFGLAPNSRLNCAVLLG